MVLSTTEGKVSMRGFLTLLIGFILSAPLTGLTADDWLQFRGPGARGVADGSSIPDSWSTEKNVAWSVETRGMGWSSPIVVGNRIIYTTVINDGKTESPRKGLYFGGNRPTIPQSLHHWMVVCRNLENGEVVWEKQVNEGRPGNGVHLKNSLASETPVSDGTHIYTYFGNHQLSCLDLKGDMVWSQKMAVHKIRFDWGTAASPVLHGDLLFVVDDNDEKSTLTAYDKKTGEQKWQVERDEKSNWATPFVWKNDVRTEIITPGTGLTRAYDLEGKELYRFKGSSSITIATPYTAHGLLYISSGYVLDGRRPIFAIRPGSEGDISLEAGQTSNNYIQWCQPLAAPYNPTTLVYKDLLYVLYDRGFFACYDAKTGEEKYGKQRLPLGRAFTSSPWASKGKIYCLNEDGVTFVIKAGSTYELLGTSSLAEDDMCMATPAIVGNKLIIRTAARIYCISGE
jgi:outer membrane protein assembly factor BamB